MLTRISLSHSFLILLAQSIALSLRNALTDDAFFSDQLSIVDSSVRVRTLAEPASILNVRRDHSSLRATWPAAAVTTAQGAKESKAAFSLPARSTRR